jgi:hypothetical protein
MAMAGDLIPMLGDHPIDLLFVSGLVVMIFGSMVLGSGA